MRYLASSFKHGIAAEDIAHALRHPLRLIELDETKTLVVGPDQIGRPLELVLVDVDGDSPRVIHAMALRPRFHRYLPKGDHR